MADTQSSLNSPTALQSFNMRGLLLTIIIDGAIPYIVYRLVSPHYPSTSVLPLILAGIAPLLGSIFSLIQKRHLDYIGAGILLGIVVSVIAAFVTGDPKVLLIRESFLTAAFGFACFVSLLFPRPIMFYFGRQIMTANDPQRVAYYNSLWQYHSFRMANYVITIVWGVGLICEFVIRVVMVLTLPIPEILLLSPIIQYAILLILIALTMLIGARAKRQGASMRSQKLAAEGQQTTLDERGSLNL